MILVDLVWTNLMVEADAATLGDITEAEQDTIDERSSNAPHDIIVSVFTSFVPQNVVQALAEDQLLGVLVSAIVVGCLLKRDSAILRAVKEVDKIVFIVINFLIKLAPIGVFFLILANLLRLNIADVGQNLGVLIGASVVSLCFAKTMSSREKIKADTKIFLTPGWHVHPSVYCSTDRLLCVRPEEPVFLVA